MFEFPTKKIKNTMYLVEGIKIDTIYPGFSVIFGNRDFGSSCFEFSF